MIVWPVEKIGPIQKNPETRVSHYLLKGSVSCKSRKIQDLHPWCAPCQYKICGAKSVDFMKKIPVVQTISDNYLLSKNNETIKKNYSSPDSFPTAPQWRSSSSVLRHRPPRSPRTGSTPACPCGASSSPARGRRCPSARRRCHRGRSRSRRRSCPS